MTQLGGVEVSRIALRAGFKGPANDEAVDLAYAVSGWNDHYEHVDATDPRRTRYGLWGLTEEETGVDNPRDLLDPLSSALILHNMYLSAGNSFDWHHAVELHDGDTFKKARAIVDVRRLRGRTAHGMPPSGTILGAISPRVPLATLMESAPYPGPLT